MVRVALIPRPAAVPGFFLGIARRSWGTFVVDDDALDLVQAQLGALDDVFQRLVELFFFSRNLAVLPARPPGVLALDLRMNPREVDPG